MNRLKNLFSLKDGNVSQVSNTVVRDASELSSSGKGVAPSPPQAPPRLRHTLSTSEKEEDLKTPPAGNCPREEPKSFYFRRKIAMEI